MHSLREALTAVERDHKTITVFAQDVHPELLAQFAERNATVIHRPLPEGYDEEFLMVSQGAEFLGSVDFETLDALTTPPINPPWDPPRPEVRKLFELLDDSIFASFDRRQMLLAAREIEERAWRTDHGTLYTGFQRESAMDAQLEVYRKLATETNLDVHLFGPTDWHPPPVPGATVHAESAGEIGEFWFLVFDGGGDSNRKCALVAEERSRGVYYGFWTFDPDRVDDLATYLRETYIESETDGR